MVRRLASATTVLIRIPPARKTLHLFGSRHFAIFFFTCFPAAQTRQGWSWEKRRAIGIPTRPDCFFPLERGVTHRRIGLWISGGLGFFHHLSHFLSPSLVAPRPHGLSSPVRSTDPCQPREDLCIAELQTPVRDSSSIRDWRFWLPPQSRPSFDRFDLRGCAGCLSSA